MRTDSLTGLLNRHAFEEGLQQAIVYTGRSQQVMALMFVDLGFFKNVNDHRGHQIGDIVLQEVAQRLLDVVRLQDCVARVGGDEFVVILEDVHSEKMAKCVGQKILESIEKLIKIANKEIFITASIGLQMYSGKTLVTADQLINRADCAMYSAKRRGRNRITCYCSNLPEEKIRNE